MASIDTMTFDQPAYAPGDTITLTIGYTPDTPSVTPVTQTATVSLNDPSGTMLSADTADFVVNQLAPGDTLAVTDTGSRQWTQVSDSGTVAVFTATA